MAIPKLKKQDVIDALKFIDENGVPEHNTGVKYVLERIFRQNPLTALTQRTIWKIWASLSRLISKKNLSYLLLPKASSQQMNALLWII